MYEESRKDETYKKIIEYEKSIHAKNQKRIQVGIRLVLLIPLIFLIIMFRLESSKVVFLVLWIVSLFGLCTYLVAVEYMDYKIQLRIEELGIRESKPVESLLTDKGIVEKAINNTRFFDMSEDELLLDENSTVEEAETIQEEEHTQAEQNAVTGFENILKDTSECIKEQDVKESVDIKDTDMCDLERELVMSIRKYVAALVDNPKDCEK